MSFLSSLYRLHLLQGDFVKRWIPELQGLKGPDVHAPWTLSRTALLHAHVTLGESYPTPIVTAPEWNKHIAKKPVCVAEKGKWADVLIASPDSHNLTASVFFRVPQHPQQKERKARATRPNSTETEASTFTSPKAKTCDVPHNKH